MAVARAVARGRGVLGAGGEIQAPLSGPRSGMDLSDSWVQAERLSRRTPSCTTTGLARRSRQNHGSDAR